MKTRNSGILLFSALFFLIFFPATVMGQSSGGMNTAKGSIGRRETAPTGPMYTGNGGSNIRLAVLAPEVQGNIPDYLPLYIQGLLNNNIKKFSAVNLIDRQNLNRIIAEQNIAASGRFSDKDFVSIGKLTNAQYFLFGTIQMLSGNKYSLQLSVTEASTGVRKANFMKNGTSAQFEDGTIINEATAELLEQLGVQLTTAGKQALLTGNTLTVLAETGLAKGITAQAGGAEVQALFNYAQAITFDPSQLEALSRLNTLSTGISGGTLSQRILEDFQARRQWLEVFKETTKFFNDHPPFEIVFDPNLIETSARNYNNYTANLGMRIALDPSNAGFDALNALLEGLEKTGRRSTWGFSNWPLTDISPKTAGTVLFNGKQNFSCKIDVSLLNDKKKTIGKNSIALTTETVKFYGNNLTKPLGVYGTVNFPNIKEEDLTPVLTIVIDAVNGIKAQNLNVTGYMKIETGDLEKRLAEREAAALATAEWNVYSRYVNTVAFSPDGKQVISSSLDGTLKLWDVASGSLIRTFSGHTSYVFSAAFSPDGRQVISAGSNDKTLKLWDVATGREIRTFSGHSACVNSAAFSPDGKQVISSDVYGMLKLWDVANGRVIKNFSGHTSSVGVVAFSPDGKRIISGSNDKTLKLWDVTSGSLIRTFSGHTSYVYAVAFSPDGKNVISGSEDTTLKLWDVASGREIRTFSGHSHVVTSVAFSPDGKQAISASYDKTLKLWDVASGRVIRTFSGHSGFVKSVAFSPDGRKVVSCSDDSVRLWNLGN